MHTDQSQGDLIIGLLFTRFFLLYFRVSNECISSYAGRGGKNRLISRLVLKRDDFPFLMLTFRNESSSYLQNCIKEFLLPYFLKIIFHRKHWHLWKDDKTVFLFKDLEETMGRFWLVSLLWTNLTQTPPEVLTLITTHLDYCSMLYMDWLWNINCSWCVMQWWIDGKITWPLQKSICLKDITLHWLSVGYQVNSQWFYKALCGSTACQSQIFCLSQVNKWGPIGYPPHTIFLGEYEWQRVFV